MRNWKPFLTTCKKISVNNKMSCTGCRSFPCRCALRTSSFPYACRPEDCCKKPKEECCLECKPETECLLVEHQLLAAATPRALCELLIKLQPNVSVPILQLIDPVSYLVEITIRNAGRRPIKLCNVFSALATSSGPFTVREVSVVRVRPNNEDSNCPKSQCLGPEPVDDCGDLLEPFVDDLEGCLCLHSCHKGFDYLQLRLWLEAGSTIANSGLAGATLTHLQDNISVVGLIGDTDCSGKSVCEDPCPAKTVLKTICYCLPS